MADEWHYGRDGNQQGPVSTSDLKRLVESGAVKPSDVVWREGMEDWQPVSSVESISGTTSASTPPPLNSTAPSASELNLLQKAIHWCTYPSPAFVPRPLPFDTSWSKDERSAPNKMDFILVVAIVLGGMLVVTILTDVLNARGFFAKLVLLSIIMGIALPFVFFRSSLTKNSLAGRWVSETDQSNWTELSKGGTFRRSDGSTGTWHVLRNCKFIDFLSGNTPSDCWKVMGLRSGMIEATLEVQSRDGLAMKFKRHPLDDAISSVFSDPARRSKMLVGIWRYADNEEHWCQFTEDGAVVTSYGPAGRFAVSGEEPSEVINLNLADGSSVSWQVVSLTKTQLVVAEDGATMILRRGSAGMTQVAAASDASVNPQPESNETVGQGFLSKVWSFVTKYKCPNCGQRAGSKKGRVGIDKWQETHSCMENNVSVQRVFNVYLDEIQCSCDKCNHAWSFQQKWQAKA